MKKHHRSLAQRTIDSLKQLWNRRQARRADNEDLRGRKKSFFFDQLENRELMASDLGNVLPNSSDNDAPAIVSPPPSGGEASVVANDLVAFAKLLSAANIKFYGAAWCPHCTATKNLFEDGAKYLPFIEVTNPDKTPNAIATANNITTYPTWVFQDNSRLTGELTLQQISTKAGIAIPQTSTPFLGELPDITLNSGSPQMVSLDGYDPNGGTLTYTVTSDNPTLVTPTVLSGNQSMRINVEGYGTMTYQLFDNFVPRVTSRIKQLVNNGFYNNTASNTINFHRVIDNFVLQAGDPTGTGSGGSTLGDFDDQFHLDLQHNRSGLLSMAKSTDDTNDSQFFITEDRESWQVLMSGLPTGGTFTLSYRGQTTAPIAFTSTGSFANVAANMQSALEGLSTIGLGNVVVSHDPVKNQSGTITENRQFRVEFQGALSGRSIHQMTGSGTGLTGGTSPTLTVTEGQPSARHLDFNHSIFGVLTEGDAIREAISEVPVGTSSKPTADVTIGSMEVFNDTENGVLMLKAAEGTSGVANITVTVKDADNQTFTRTFRVDVRADNKNGAPFLGETEPISIVTGGTANFNIQAFDVENNPIYYDAVKVSGETVNYTLNVNHDTGAVSITPPANFTGTFDVILGVRGQTGTDTGDTFDSQIVTVNVGPAGTVTLDLNDASDTGSNNADNVTNAGTLNFLVSGVTSGATVKLYNGNTVIAQGNATGTTITLSTTAIATLGSGTYQISASQTVSGAEGPKSTAIPLVFDNTAPGAFTSTGPTEATEGVTYTYNAQSPDEGNAGYVYSLASGAPAGLSINPQTGIVSWTPTTAQVGQHTYGILGTDLAGNSVNQSVTVTVASATPKDVQVILKVVDANGNVLNNLNVGQEFFLAAFVSDTRPESDGPLFGVFSFYTDVTYTSNVMVNGAIDHQNLYTGGLSGNTTTTGVLDEVGGFANTLTALGRGEFPLFRVPMKATAGGNVTFTANPRETEGLDMTVFGGPLVAPADVNFGTTTATVGLDFAAVNDTVNFNEDSTNQTINPLANDTVQNGTVSELVITAAGTTSNGGTVTVSGDGKSLVYTPAANFHGLETFTYTIRRGASGATTTGTINVQVQPVNDAPNAVDDTKTVNEDSTDNSIDVIANDQISPDTNETLTVSAVTQGNHGGTISIGPGGSTVRYTPAANFIGTETFTYTVRDTGGLTDTATVTVTVTDANDNPVAVNDTATTTEDIASPININVLANDNSGNETGETLTVQSVGTTSNGGTVTRNSDGLGVSYKPAANFQGTETFTYVLSDGKGGTATGTVTVTVTNVNDVPVGTNDSLNAFKNSTTTLNVLANDTTGVDPTTEALIVSAVTQGSNGATITITEGGGSIKYTPAANFTGTDTFTYTVRDAGGLTATATVTVTVQNFAPSSLGGFVFKNGTTGPLAGVTITLTGTDVNNAAVSKTATTGADGSYIFEALIPGTYKIKETQPVFMVDGADVVGSQGGTLSANDEISITLVQGTTGTGNNFSEAGLVPAVTNGTGSTATTTFTMRKSDLFSHNSKNYVLAAVDTSTGQTWYSDVGSSFLDSSTQTSFALNSTGANATDPKLTIQTKTTAGVQQAATISTSNPNVRTIASSGNMRLYRLRGNASFYSFAPVNTTASTSGGESAGEFIDPQQAQATDTLMALLGSQDNDDDGNDSN